MSRSAEIMIIRQYHIFRRELTRKFNVDKKTLEGQRKDEHVILESDHKTRVARLIEAYHSDRDELGEKEKAELLAERAR